MHLICSRMSGACCHGCHKTRAQKSSCRPRDATYHTLSCYRSLIKESEICSWIKRTFLLCPSQASPHLTSCNFSQRNFHRSVCLPRARVHQHSSVAFALGISPYPTAHSRLKMRVVNPCQINTFSMKTCAPACQWYL